MRTTRAGKRIRCGPDTLGSVETHKKTEPDLADGTLGKVRRLVVPIGIIEKRKAALQSFFFNAPSSPYVVFVKWNIELEAKSKHCRFRSRKCILTKMCQ